MNMPAFVETITGDEPRAARRDPLQRHVQEVDSIVRRTGWVLLAGVVPIVGWLALAPLSSAVVAPGVVKVDTNRVPIQHVEGGTVRRVLVRDGQKVQAGETLFELGDVAVAADKTRLDYRLLAERASAIRLEAEQMRAAGLQWPTELQDAARQDPGLAGQLAKEQALFRARRDALVNQGALLRQQKTKIDQEIATLKQQIAKASESMTAQKRELESNRSLIRDGFVAPTRVMQLEASVSDYDAKLEERRGELIRAEQRLVDIDLKLGSLDDSYRQQASDQLKTTMVRIQEIEQELRKATDASSRQIITAPISGELMGLKVTNPGVVIAPREPIAEVVPHNPKLLVEARIRTEDVSRVHVGQHAELRLTAYKYRTTHSVPGEVSYVSADRIVEPQTQAAYYTVHVEVGSDAVAKATQGEKLQAGMPAEVYIEGAQRTPLQYLFEPVTQVLRKAGREN